MITIRSHKTRTPEISPPTKFFDIEFELQKNMTRKLDQLDIIFKKEGEAFVNALRDYTKLLLSARRDQRIARLNKTQEQQTIVHQQYSIVVKLIDELILSNKQANELDLRVKAINDFSDRIAKFIPTKTNAFAAAIKKVLYYATHFIGGSVLGFIPGFAVGFSSVSGASIPFAPMVMGLAVGLLFGGMTGIGGLSWAYNKSHLQTTPNYAKLCHHFYGNKDIYTKEAEKVVNIAKDTPIVYKKP